MVKVEQKILIETGGQKLALSKQEAEQLLGELKRELSPSNKFDPKLVDWKKLADDFNQRKAERKAEFEKAFPPANPYNPWPLYRDVRFADRTGIDPISPYIVTSTAKQ